MAGIESTLGDLSRQKGVQGIIFATVDGIAITTTLDHATTQLYMSTIQPLLISARAALHNPGPFLQASEEVKTLDGQENHTLTMLRLHTEKNEILVAPEKEGFVIVIQDISN